MLADLSLLLLEFAIESHCANSPVSHCTCGQWNFSWAPFYDFFIDTLTMLTHHFFNLLWAFLLCLCLYKSYWGQHFDIVG